MGFGAMHYPRPPARARETAVAVARRAVGRHPDRHRTPVRMGANEELLAEALYPYPDDLLIATKVGVAPPGQ